MNRFFHKVIFNQSTGLMIAVCETAHNNGKSSKDKRFQVALFGLSGSLNTDLTAAKDVNIKAAKEIGKEHNNFENIHAAVGAVISFNGNGASIGVTAEGEYGKGKANADNTTHRNSHIGSSTGQTNITAGETLNIQGGQVQGKGVGISAKDLNIESLHDTAIYHSKQQNLSGSVTIGAGANGTIGYNQSKINSDYASINEQSGIFAGDDGYQIHIKNHTDLTGGLITSTANAEQNGKNSFATGTITFADLANKAEYSGNGFGIGVSGTIAGTPNNNLINVANKYSLSSDGIGYGHDSQSQQSVSKSGINTANITIRDNEKQQALTGKSVEETIQAVKTDITLENHQNLSGRLDNNFDANRVQSEIDLQVEVTQEFSRNLQDYNRQQNQRKDKLKAQLENNEISQKEYEEQVKIIERQNLGLNMVAGGLLAPSDSVLGIATSTLAPAASYQVGQYFKDLADQNPNGELTTSQKTAHIATHAILGVATAGASGGNALSGAISAGGAEALAPIVAKVLYGKDNSQNLTADEKETVVSVTSAISTLAGGAIGDSSANAYIGNTVAGNAVANNWLTAEQNIRKKEIEQLLRQKLQLADSILGGDIDRAKINALMKELRALEKESADNDRQLEAAINSCIDYLSCDTLKKIHWDLRRELSEKGWAKFEQDRKNGNIEKNWRKLSEDETAFHNFDENGKKILKDPNGNYYNEKWVDKATGQYEVILDRRTGKTIYEMKIVTDNTNGGTFNFYPPEGIDNVGHLNKDVRPWALVGNGADDKTDYSVRTSGKWGWLGSKPLTSNNRIEEINNEIRNPKIKAPAGNYDMNQLFYFYQW